MIQIYKASNTDYTTNGDAVLVPSECFVCAKLNSSWGVSLIHPIDNDGKWSLIKEEAVVKLPSFNGDQLFRIKHVIKGVDTVDTTMEPIFYDAMGDCFLEDVRPTEKTGQEALDIMTAANPKYSGSSDITRTSTAYYELKNLMDCINGNDDNSFINRWGGEIYFNNYTVIINERQGDDHGVVVSYGKNIPADGFFEDVDVSEVVTRIYPQAYNGYRMTTERKYVDSPLINSYPTIKTKKMVFEHIKMAVDVSNQEENNDVIICNTDAELNAALISACEEQYSRGIDKPRVSISVNMVLLDDMAGYEDYKALEAVHLGDIITCKNERLGVETKERVIELKWDAIKERISAVVLGRPKYNYFDNVTSTADLVNAAIRKNGTVIAQQVAGVVNAARAQLKLQNTIAKKQDVRAILFEDLDPASDTYGAMALGTQGFQIASERLPDNSGWKWTTFGTAKGFFADLIVAGTLRAIQIEGGSVSGAQINGCVISGGKILSQQWSESGDVCLTTKIENGTVEISHIFYVDELGQPYPQGWGSMIHVDKNSGDFRFSEVNGDNKKTGITIGAQGIRVISPSNPSTHTTISSDIIRVIRNGAQVWSV